MVLPIIKIVCTVKFILCVISFMMHLSLQMIYSGALSSPVIMVKKLLPTGKYDTKNIEITP